MIYLESGSALSSRALSFFYQHSNLARISDLARAVIRYTERTQQEFIFPRKTWNPLQRISWIIGENPTLSFAEILKIYKAFTEFDSLRLFAFDIKNLLLNSELLDSHTQSELLLYYKEILFLKQTKSFIPRRNEEIFFATQLLKETPKNFFQNNLNFVFSPLEPLEDELFLNSLEKQIPLTRLSHEQFRTQFPTSETYFWLAPQTPSPQSAWGPFHTQLSKSAYLNNQLEFVRSMSLFIDGFDLTNSRHLEFAEQLTKANVRPHNGAKASWTEVQRFFELLGIDTRDCNLDRLPESHLREIFDFCLSQNMFSQSTSDNFYLEQSLKTKQSVGPHLLNPNEFVYFSKPILVGIDSKDSFTNHRHSIHTDLMNLSRMDLTHRPGLEKSLLAVGYPRSQIQNSALISDFWNLELDQLLGRASFLIARTPDSVSATITPDSSASSQIQPKEYRSPLSPSSAELYFQCPRKFYYQKINKLTPADMWDPLSIPANKWGSLIHKVIELAHAHSQPSHQVFVELLKAQVSNYFSTQVSSRYLATITTHFDSIAQRLSIFWERFETPLKQQLQFATRSEHELKIESHWLSTQWIGRIDRVDTLTLSNGTQVGFLWDYKTGTPPSTKAATQISSGNFQWFIYKKLYELLNPAITILGGGYLQPIKPENSFLFLYDNEKDSHLASVVHSMADFFNTSQMEYEFISGSQITKLDESLSTHLTQLCTKLSTDKDFQAQPVVATLCERCDYNTLCARSFT